MTHPATPNGRLLDPSGMRVQRYQCECKKKGKPCTLGHAQSAQRDVWAALYAEVHTQLGVERERLEKAEDQHAREFWRARAEMLDEILMHLRAVQPKE